jgi:hypothetical protein
MVLVDRRWSASNVLGDLARAIADAEPDSIDRLIAIAELYHAFSFDRVTGCDVRLDYEPRCSDACPACCSLWVGTKAGEVLRLGLTSRSLGTRKARVAGGVRALRHLHRRGQIVAGLDIGYLLAFDAETLALRGGCHLGRALAGLERAAGNDAEFHLPLEPCTQLEDSEDTDRFLYGITALLELPGTGDDPVDLLVATRTPALLVVRLDADGVVVRARHALPGWSRGLVITGAPEDPAVLCVTRTGELLEWSCRALRETPRAGATHRASTHLLPTVVAAPLGPPRDAHAVFIGANDGLYIRRELGANPVQVAATRGAVLSLDTVRLPAHAGDLAPRVYVALGLEDGRLRVIEQDVLFAWLDGKPTPPGAHDFRVPMGSEPLVLSILEADDPTARFVLVALRDHRLRLFHVRSRDAVLRDVMAAWRTQIEAPDADEDGPLSERQRDVLLACERELRAAASPRGEAALRYLLVDQVLPDWARRRDARDERLVRRACELARGDDKLARRGDDRVLYGLSATMGQIARDDAKGPRMDKSTGQPAFSRGRMT